MVGWVADLGAWTSTELRLGRRGGARLAALCQRIMWHLLWNEDGGGSNGGREGRRPYTLLSWV